MNITINTEIPLSDTDRDVLRALLGETLYTRGGVTTVNVNVPPDEEEPAPAAKKAAPAKKTAPAKKAAAKKAEPEPEPEDDPEDEPVEGNTDEDDESEPDEDGADPLDLAVARATELLSEGETAKVKAALKAAGAKKVSELKGASVQKFLDALD
jgi:hypothetical protein